MAQAATEVTGGLEGEPQVSSVSELGLAWRRLRRRRLAMVALAFIVVFYVSGILASFLTDAGVLYNYRESNLDVALQGPSFDHPFGTDRLGRDQLTRVIWAARTTVIVTAATLLTGGLILGVSLGLISGYVGGWVDNLIMRVGDAFASLPGILMLILINATLKERVRDLAGDIENLTGIDGLVKSGAPDYFLVFGALSLFGWVGTARILRSQVLSLREREFILAARSLGAPTSRILFRHLFPNIANVVIVGLSASLATIAGSEIVLTWFGVGIQPPNPSFGSLIYDSSSVRTVNVHAYLLLFPGIVVVGLIYSFNLLGDALTDVFTPKAR